MTEDRYARHRLIAWWDQARLQRARVLVAGAGAVGNEVLKTLALLGTGHLLIVDFDRIEPSNLSRAVLFRAADVGRLKAEVAAERVRDLNPEVTVEAICGDLEYAVGLGVYRSCDVVIGCLDSLAARVALNRVCRRAGVPWINCGIEVTEAEVALFGGVETMACFACGLSDAMWARLNERHSCGGLRRDAPEDRVPTTAVMASLAATYAANEAVALLHSNTESRGLEWGQKLYLTLRPYALHLQTSPFNPECPEHEVWQPVEVLEQTADTLTPVHLLTTMGMPEGTLELGFDLLTRMHCLHCQQVETILRPVEQCAVTLNQCPHCGKPERQPETISRLDAGSEWAQHSLAALRMPEYQIFAVRAQGLRRYVQITGEFR